LCFFAGVKEIIEWLKEYASWVNKQVFFSSVAFAAILIFINYYFQLNHFLKSLPAFSEYLSWFIIFAIAFSFPYILNALKKAIYFNKPLLLLILIASAIFAWKMSYNFNFLLSPDPLKNTYWNAVVYWPLKLAVISFLLWVIWLINDRKQSFYGLTRKGFKSKPYFVLLFLMIPLIAAASFQKDFLQLYPRFQNIPFLKSEDSGFFISLFMKFLTGLIL
jgi:hypothetical protein